MLRLSTEARFLAIRLLVVFGLLIFFALAVDTTLQLSPTTDEPVHLLRGYILWKYDDLHLQYEHAPLSHRLIGTLLHRLPDLPTASNLATWSGNERLAISQELLWDHAVNVERMLFAGRLPIVWMALVLGAAVASWARAWLGPGALVLATALFAFSPNLLSAASLSTTDLTATATYFLAVYTWWRYLRWQRKRWWLLAALFLGLALASKLTAVLLLPVMLALAYIYYRPQAAPLWQPALRWLGLLPGAGLVLWAIYGFELAAVDNWPVILPAATYVESWLRVLHHVETGHATFLLGEVSREGWWHYFPVVSLLKTPLLTLILSLLAVVVLLSRCRDQWREVLFLLLPVAALFAAAVVSRLNIGFRHVLPMVPFLIVFATLAGDLLFTRRAYRLLLGAGILLYAFGTLRQHPHHLAYLNPLAGGSANGYRYVADSNLDWGQGLKLLAEEVEASDAHWHVGYAGVGDPLYYGLDSAIVLDVMAREIPFPAANPDPGRYAISATYWQGLLPDADLFDWFRRHTPTTTLGGSILIYDVAAPDSGEWIAHCLDPAPLLGSDDAEQLVGRQNVRHVSFDCRQSWVFPEVDSGGWWIVPQSDSWWVQALLPSELAAQMELVYRHDASDRGPSYDVYYWPGAPSDAVAAAVASEAVLPSGEAVSLPHAISRAAALVGHNAVANSWYTYWLVTDAAEPALSVQAHLYQGTSPPLVADSLGYDSAQWQAGDLFIQRHEFPVAAESGELETGLYDFRTLEPAGGRLRLTPR